jgi:hypothetical protein
VSSNKNQSKRCPKCGSGSVYLDCDENDWYRHCLLCGFMTPVKASDIKKEREYSFSLNQALVSKSMEFRHGNA